MWIDGIGFAFSNYDAIGQYLFEQRRDVLRLVSSSTRSSATRPEQRASVAVLRDGYSTRIPRIEKRCRFRFSVMRWRSWGDTSASPSVMKTMSPRRYRRPARPSRPHAEVRTEMTRKRHGRAIAVFIRVESESLDPILSSQRLPGSPTQKR